MLQNQFAATSVAGTTTSPSSVVAAASEGGYDIDSEEWSEGDDEGDFKFPNAASVVVVEDGASASRTAKGSGKGKSAAGNVVKSQKDDRPDNLWSKVPQGTGRTFRKQIEEDDICPVHGVVCSKGICSVMKKRKREKEIALKREERERERATRKKEKEKEKMGERGAIRIGEDEGEEGELEEVKSVNGPATSVARSVSGTSSKGKDEDRFSSVGAQSKIKGNWGPKRGA